MALVKKVIRDIDTLKSNIKQDQSEDTTKTAAEKEISEYNKTAEKYEKKLKKEQQKAEYKNKLSAMLFPTYSKTIVTVIIIVCMIDLQLSYVLAFLGRQNVVESLSIQLCITILGTVLVYLIKSVFENISKYGFKKNISVDTKDNKTMKVLTDLVNAKTADVLNNGVSGANVSLEDEPEEVEDNIPDEES